MARGARTALWACGAPWACRGPTTGGGGSARRPSFAAAAQSESRIGLHREREGREREGGGAGKRKKASPAIDVRFSARLMCREENLSDVFPCILYLEFLQWPYLIVGELQGRTPQPPESRRRRSWIISSFAFYFLEIPPKLTNPVSLASRPRSYLHVTLSACQCRIQER